MSENTPMQRPLSPHIQIYRWTLTMMLSILHRATGIALYAGTALLAWWLLARPAGGLMRACRQYRGLVWQAGLIWL